MPVAPNSATNVSTRASALSFRAIIFRHVVLLCSAALFVGLLSLTRGLDLSFAFF